VHELQLLTERHRIVLDLPAVPLMIEGNALRVEQVLYNLMHNAVKYSPTSGTVTVTARQDRQQAVISVTDEGVGIPPPDLPHVFERFYRAANVPQTDINGLGLGLYLVKEFVELHGRTVEVQSVVEQGTIFHVTLPLIPA
jgi:signal transduction histidine kinase